MAVALVCWKLSSQDRFIKGCVSDTCVCKVMYLFWEREHWGACVAANTCSKCKSLWGVVQVRWARSWVLSFENWPLKPPRSLLFLRCLRLLQMETWWVCGIFRDRKMSKAELVSTHSSDCSITSFQCHKGRNCIICGTSGGGMLDLWS